MLVPTVRIETKGRIVFYTLSPDGKTLAYGDTFVRPDQPYGMTWNGTELVLIDFPSGKELQRSTWKRGIVTGGLFSPDGKMLAVGSRQACVWDVATWKQRVALEGTSGVPFAYSPDGSKIAGTVQGCLVFWDATTGKVQPLETRAQPGKDPPVLQPGQYPVGSKPSAATGIFSDDGSVLFVECLYWSDELKFKSALGDIEAWDATKGKFLALAGAPSYTIRRQKLYDLLVRTGSSMPGSALLSNRFRVISGNRILVLPRYDAVPYNVFPH